MSDDEADPELLELLRQSLGISNNRSDEVSSDTGVLADAKYIYDNAIDVSIDMYGTKDAAASIYKSMQERGYSTDAWSQHELHPKPSEGFAEVDIVNFIFIMDLLNFSFWSELPEADRFQVEYRERRWTGYNSLLACLRRALDEGIPVTTPRYLRSSHATNEVLRRVFRSATSEEIPLLDERIALLREAAEESHKSFGDPDEPDDLETHDLNHVDGAQPESSNRMEPYTENEMRTAVGADNIALSEEAVTPRDTTEGAESDTAVPLAQPTAEIDTEPDQTAPSASASASRSRWQHDLVLEQQISTAPDFSVVRLIEKADHSAGKLVNLLAKHFPAFRDETRFDGKKVRLLKRAQILVADLWAAFGGTGCGEFSDIDSLTMFADYRVPQVLHSLGVLIYSPPLDRRIRTLQPIDSGRSWEVQLRGCSIYAIELVRREILRAHLDAEVNAVLIDFFLYDLAKEREMQGGLAAPHHRTRSIWY